MVFLPFHLDGAYLHEAHTIIVNCRLSPVRQRCVLAHEYVHALRGDTGLQSARVEELVEARAARLLISEVDYQVAEGLYGMDLGLIAEELHVSLNTLIAFRCGLKPD